MAARGNGEAVPGRDAADNHFIHLIAGPVPEGNQFYVLPQRDAVQGRPAEFLAAVQVMHRCPEDFLRDGNQLQIQRRPRCQQDQALRQFFRDAQMDRVFQGRPQKRGFPDDRRRLFLIQGRQKRVPAGAQLELPGQARFLQSLAGKDIDQRRIGHHDRIPLFQAGHGQCLLRSLDPFRQFFERDADDVLERRCPCRKRDISEIERCMDFFNPVCRRRSCDPFVLQRPARHFRQCRCGTELAHHGADFL